MYNNIHIQKHRINFKTTSGYTIKNDAIILGNTYTISTGHKQTVAFQVGSPSFIHLVKAFINNIPNSTVGIITIIIFS